MAEIASPAETQALSPKGKPGVGIGVWLLGTVLILVVATFIVLGPSVLSQTTYTSLLLVQLGVGVGYGAFVALRSRNAHLATERQYSSHLEELSQRLRTMAYRDVLTGLYNHRFFHEQLSHEIERSVRYGQPLTILLFDMDNFKKINDTYGHIVGDKYLGLVGQIVARHIRSSDIGARYGGDEFAVILPNTNADEARVTADKLEDAVARSNTLSPGEESIKIGVSIGYATCPFDARVPGELLEAADRRLYAVKTEHRRPPALRETA